MTGPHGQEIKVGDRVHWGCTSPDTGIVLSITKNRKWARVAWDMNGTRRAPMASLFSVTRSLTEWSIYRSGKTPCVDCGYDAERLNPHERRPGGDVCDVCRFRRTKKEAADA